MTETAYPVLVLAAGVPLCVVGVVLCVRLARVRFGRLSATTEIGIGIAHLSVAAFWKLAAFVGIVAIPVASVGVANWHTFVGTHESAACARCHVMRPMVNDLEDEASYSLASRHARNRWIPKDPCFECHSDYGFGGDVSSKLEGFRHLARYTTQTYTEPIAARARYDNQNCLKCHDGMPKFEAQQSHHTLRERLASSDTSCLNCHGPSHPTRAQRTPGSADYPRLMEPYE
jgi:nitrate/TMAO reductase-like tetraheme cytochrome c subunit